MTTKYYLSTTGTTSQINLKDLGLIFNHPTINHNLLDRVTLEVLLNSKSLHDSLINNEITLKDENNTNIDSQNYYQRESIPLISENKVKTSNLDLSPDFLVNKIEGVNDIIITEEVILGQRKIRIGNSSGFDKNFVYHQPTSTISVDIIHNLNKYPSVTITDYDTLEEIDVFWKYIDINTVRVAPQIPITFKVFFN